MKTSLYLCCLWALALCLSGCSRRFKHFSVWRLTASDKQIWKSFEGAPEQPVVFYFRSGDKVLRGWEIGSDSLPTTLLLHGAPSSMVKFRAWFRDPSFFSQTRLVAVDRPGYGKSGYGKAVTSIERQVEYIAPLLDRLSKRGPIIVYGSSYGGAVAARLAMKYPEKVKGLVLQSASVQPGAERAPKIAYWIRSPLGLVFPKWAQVATKEKFRHREALSEIQDGWADISCPVWILHGQMDDLIFPSNAEYAFAQLRAAPRPDIHYARFDTLGHNIYWRQRDVVKQCLLDAVNCAQ